MPLLSQISAKSVQSAQIVIGHLPVGAVLRRLSFVADGWCPEGCPKVFVNILRFVCSGPVCMALLALPSAGMLSLRNQIRPLRCTQVVWVVVPAWEDTPWKLYFTCLYFTSYTITSVGYGDIGPAALPASRAAFVISAFSVVHFADVCGAVSGGNSGKSSGHCLGMVWAPLVKYLEVSFSGELFRHP